MAGYLAGVRARWRELRAMWTWLDRFAAVAWLLALAALFFWLATR